MHKYKETLLGNWGIYFSYESMGQGVLGTVDWYLKLGERCGTHLPSELSQITKFADTEKLRENNFPLFEVIHLIVF